MFVSVGRAVEVPVLIKDTIKLQNNKT